ncbi:MULTISPECIES: DUF1127 domain-containing protein [Falsihalocynthiibacter]|uniref:DUF1127 domain-containing protein n=1 Tax=Falsihalocynthiibacter TaxID=2854182 RepID=UPI0030038912
MTHTITSSGPITLKSPTKTLRLLSMIASTYRQRRALARLDDAALTDLGLSRSDATQEANRPIWDVPAAWRR